MSGKSFMKFVIVTLFLLLLIMIGKSKYQWQPEHYLDSEGIVKHYGYVFERHVVQTEDGYVLELHRVKREQNLTNERIVVLGSGLLMDSASWLIQGTEHSLGFILADHGYDVWLVNTRGTARSRKHLILHPEVDKKEFWNFSFHEIGYYDLPAVVDYVLKKTMVHKEILYVGHSQAISSIFVTMSRKPEYNSKIKLVVAISPCLTFTYTESIFGVTLIACRNILEYIAESFYFYEIIARNLALKTLSRILCTDYSPFQKNVCSFWVPIVSGGTNHFNYSMVPAILSNALAGGSIKQFLHYTQLNKGLFSHYDYGIEENIKLYGQDVPPEYDLSKVNVPIKVYLGREDYLCTPEDFRIIAQKIPRVESIKTLHGYNHIDTLYGVDVANRIYYDIVETLGKYR